MEMQSVLLHCMLPQPALPMQTPAQTHVWVSTFHLARLRLTLSGAYVVCVAMLAVDF